MRGTILRITREQAVTRVLSQITAMPLPPAGTQRVPISYRQRPEGGYNGGFDPSAPHCASWSYGNRTPTADCIGLLLWASGIDRDQPGYKGSRGEWLNCASLLDDADGAGKFCRPLAKAESPIGGDWVLTRDHCGMLVRPETATTDALVVDCSPRHGRKTAVNTGGFWSDACRVIRPLVYS
jgi:hypothetical protein